MSHMHPFASRLQVIASTAHAMPNELEECLAVGMNFTATKPLQQAEFQALVREAGRITREHRDALGMNRTAHRIATAGYPQSEEVLRLQRTLAQLVPEQLLGNQKRPAQRLGVAPVKKEEVQPYLQLLSWSCTVLGLHASLAQLMGVMGLSGVADALVSERRERTDAFRLLSQVSDQISAELLQLDGLSHRAVALGAAIDSRKLLKQARTRAPGPHSSHAFSRHSAHASRGRRDAHLRRPPAQPDAARAVRKFVEQYAGLGEQLGAMLEAGQWEAMQQPLFTFELAARRLGAHQSATTAATMEEAVSSSDERDRTTCVPWLLARLVEDLALLFEQLKQVERGPFSPSP